MSYNLNSIIGQNYGPNSLYAKINNAITAKKDDNLLGEFNNLKKDGLTIDDVLQLESKFKIDLDGDGKQGIVLGVTANNTEAAVTDKNVKDISKEDLKTIGDAFAGADVQHFGKADLQKLASDGTLPNGEKADPAAQRAATALLNNPETLDNLDGLGEKGATDGLMDGAYWSLNFTNAIDNDSLIPPPEDPPAAEDPAAEDPKEVKDPKDPKDPAADTGDLKPRDILSNVSTAMDDAGLKNFTDADLKALAAGDGKFTDATEEQQAAAQSLLDNQKLKLALDVFGGEAGAMNGAQDGAYWTASANDANVNKVAGAYRNLVTGGALSTDENGETTLDGQSLEQALGREDEGETETRHARQTQLQTLLGIEGLATSTSANGSPGFSYENIKEIAENGSLNGKFVTPDQQKAAKAVLADPALLKAIDNVSLDGTQNDANADNWYNKTAIQNQMLYILRYAAKVDTTNEQLG